MNPEKTGLLALEAALEKTRLRSPEDLHYILGTGYGRRGASFIRENMSEITCHARAAHWLYPTFFSKQLTVSSESLDASAVLLV